MDSAFLKNWFMVLLFASSTQVRWVSSVNTNHSSKHDLLLDGYDKYVRPMFGVGPIQVDAHVLINSFGIIEEAKMEIPVYLFFRQYWTDRRLAGKLNHSITFSGSVIEKFWTPDVYCYNARQSNLMVKDDDVNSALDIQPNGSVFYTRGSTIIAACNMNLHNFPMDTQHCNLTFGSYSQNDEDIVFHWKENEEISVEQREMSQFDLGGITLGHYVQKYADGANFTKIYFTISLTRRYGYYIIQAYCPDVLIVSLSWIILWMDAEAIGERLSLGITTVLTIMFLLGSTNASMPKVSYAKAIDWYLLVSFAFVFMTLVESMLVFLLSHANDEGKTPTREKGSRKTRLPERIPMILNLKRDSQDYYDAQEQQPQVEANRECLGNAEHSKVSDRKSKKSICVNKHTLKKCANTIDKCSRLLFPLAFVVYNVVYWSTYG